MNEILIKCSLYDLYHQYKYSYPPDNASSKVSIPGILCKTLSGKVVTHGNLNFSMKNKKGL